MLQGIRISVPGTQSSLGFRWLSYRVGRNFPHLSRVLSLCGSPLSGALFSLSLYLVNARLPGLRGLHKAALLCLSSASLCCEWHALKALSWSLCLFSITLGSLFPLLVFLALQPLYNTHLSSSSGCFQCGGGGGGGRGRRTPCHSASYLVQADVSTSHSWEVLIALM